MCMNTCIRTIFSMATQNYQGSDRQSNSSIQSDSSMVRSDGLVGNINMMCLIILKFLLFPFKQTEETLKYILYNVIQTKFSFFSHKSAGLSSYHTIDKHPNYYTSCLLCNVANRIKLKKYEILSQQIITVTRLSNRLFH